MQSLIFAIPDFKLFHPILHVLLTQSWQCSGPTQNKTKGRGLNKARSSANFLFYRPRLIRLFLFQ